LSLQHLRYVTRQTGQKTISSCAKTDQLIYDIERVYTCRIVKLVYPTGCVDAPGRSNVLHEN